MAGRPKRKTVMQAKPHDRQAHDLTINAIVAAVVVDDPYERGEKVAVVASLRDDILRHLLVRGEIDEAQFQAGRKYERHAERSQIGAIKAMDPTKEPVDGGGMIPESITDEQIDAVRELAEAGRVLGRKSEELVRAILIDRRKFKEIAASVSERDVLYVRRRFFEGLEELAVFWNFAGRKA